MKVAGDYLSEGSEVRLVTVNPGNLERTIMLSSSSRHFRLSAFLAALAWCLPAAAPAMIISHDREDADYRAFSEQFVDIHVEMNVPGPDGAPAISARA